MESSSLPQSISKWAAFVWHGIVYLMCWRKKLLQVSNCNINFYNIHNKITEQQNLIEWGTHCFLSSGSEGMDLCKGISSSSWAMTSFAFTCTPDIRNVGPFTFPSLPPYFFKQEYRKTYLNIHLYMAIYIYLYIIMYFYKTASVVTYVNMYSIFLLKK